MARGHFALARRYLRLFKWIDFSQLTLQSLTEPDSTRLTLKTTKNALLAIYFFMEMFCIVSLSLSSPASFAMTKRTKQTNAMNITTSTFLTSLQHHALQVWFFAISVSLLLTFYDALCLHTPKRQLYTSLIIDACDLLIPGSAVDWIPVSSVTVGIASSISSIIVGQQIWARVQKQSRETEQKKREKAARKVRFDAGTKEEEEKSEVTEKMGNGVVGGSVKALVSAVGDGNGSVKKRGKKA
ncbi:hypothetical protein E4T44_10043 [Aureobasidium sp. EXF-8845]|nr:hypothetical protein E4T44_10043 [Aureobasidium sp. EXF-8845]